MSTEIQELKAAIMSLASDLAQIKAMSNRGDIAETIKGAVNAGSMAMAKTHKSPAVPVKNGKTVPSKSFELVYMGGNDFGVVEGDVYLSGTEVSESVGSPFSFLVRYVNTNAFEVTADTYGWIDLDESAPSWTMNTGASVPAPASGHQIKPLFKIAWDGVNSIIDPKNCKRYHTGDVHFAATTPDGEILEVDEETLAEDDFLMWDEATGGWINVASVALDVVTGIAYSETTGKLTYTTRPVRVVATGEAPAATEVFEAEECDA